MTNRWTTRLFLVAAVAIFGAHTAFAIPIGQLTFQINGNTLDTAALNCVTTGTNTTCGGTNLMGAGFRLDSWSFLLDPDPSISGSFSVTNLSSSTQTFAVSATLGGIVPVGPPVLASGSIGDGTLTDLNGGGATLTDAAGVSIYTALIDGVAVQTLLNAPQSYTVTPGPLGPGPPLTIPKATFGPTVLAQSANSTIGVAFRFTLTGGDRVAFPFEFNVDPVPTPEPSSLMLLASGLACSIGVFRRRTRR